MSKIIEFEEIIDASKNLTREMERKLGHRGEISIDSKENIVQNFFEKLFVRPKVRVKGVVIPIDKQTNKREVGHLLQHAEKKELERIQNMIKHTESSNNVMSITNFDGLEYVKNVLIQNDFSQNVINMVVEFISKNVKIHELADSKRIIQMFKSFLKQKICFYPLEGLSTYDGLGHQKVISFIGATGVGKTTFLSNIVNDICIKNIKLKDDEPKIVVRLANLDYFKMTAIESIQKIANLLSVKCECVRDVECMRKYMRKKNKEAYNLLLIDTPGHRIKHKTSEQENTLMCLNSIKSHNKTYLVVSGTDSYKNILAVIKEFEIYNYCGIIITKLDEVQSIGAVLSVCIEKSIPITYLVSGMESQKLEEANLLSIMKKIHGLSV